MFINTGFTSLNGMLGLGIERLSSRAWLFSKTPDKNSDKGAHFYGSFATNKHVI
jgi:hypothetical protein